MIIKRSLTVFLIILILISIPFGAFAAYEHGDVAAAYVVDHTTGEVLYSFNENAPLPPASTTKMLTALLVLEAVERGEISLDDIVTVTEETIDTIPFDASRMDIPLDPGEEMPLMDLLYAHMISSDCLASNVLGAYVSGNIEEFVKLMNTRAAELGCNNTVFTNPSGYPDPNMYTTALSLYIIAEECMKHELFREIVSTPSVTLAETNHSYERTLYNSNRLLHKPEINENVVYENPYYYEHAIGIKTGYSSSSGYCLVSASSYNGHEIFAVVLGGKEIDHGNDIYTYTQYIETINLYNYFYDLIYKQEVLQTMFDSRTEQISAASVDAVFTHDKILEEEITIRQAFKLQQQENELRQKKIIIISSAALIAVIAGFTVLLILRKRKKELVIK